MPELQRTPDRNIRDPGPFLARVINHIDPEYMGMLNVEILRDVGNTPKSTGQLVPVKYMSPFYGVTGYEFNGKDNDHASTQKSYGMWMVPPDPGTLVMVIFVEGNPRSGYWIGCVPDQYMNFMTPGLAATTLNPDGERKPVSEYNKKANDESKKDATKIEKPVHPFYDALKEQGLEKDETRGYTTSSARRDIPSMVFGISTPGPIDRTGPKKKVGTKENSVDAFVSRLGGSTFVMDDGDDKFQRKKKPQDGPPEYAAVEDGEKGEAKIPHNELIRLRTRTGHQIVLHNSEDLIYIGNARGTSWIEMTSDGKIDIYAEDSISVHSKQDMNFFADRDLNVEVGRNFNLKVKEEMHTHVLKDQILIVDGDQKIQIKKRVDETIEEEYRLTVHKHVKHVFKDDCTVNVLGRYDAKIKKGTSIDIGDPAFNESVIKFAPFEKESHIQDLEQADVSGPAEDKVFIKVHYDTLVEQKDTNLDVHVDGHLYTTTGSTYELNAGGNIIETAPKIHFNGPTATKATKPQLARTSAKADTLRLLKTHTLPDEKGEELTKSIMRRVPTHEPWPHHENLDPKEYKPEKTDRDIDDRWDDNSESIKKTPDLWKKELTMDTFKKIGK
jgi:hypothetical protein